MRARNWARRSLKSARESSLNADSIVEKVFDLTLVATRKLQIGCSDFFYSLNAVMRQSSRRILSHPQASTPQ